MSKNKKKKLQSLPIIIRRLFRIASELCRTKAGNKCEICGLKSGDIYQGTGKKQRVEAHHIMSRANKGSPLKFDLRNLICLCSFHHKLGSRSAHKHCLWFSKWFIEHRPDDANWIIEHTDDKVDLNDRIILQFIEDCLKFNKPLDFNENQMLKDISN